MLPSELSRAIDQWVASNLVPEVLLLILFAAFLLVVLKCVRQREEIETLQERYQHLNQSKSYQPFGKTRHIK